MARPRSKKYQGLPPNLVYDVKNKQFRYRRPDNGKYSQMGTDRLKAVSAAKQLNSILMKGHDLVARVLGTKPALVTFINDHFIKRILPERNLTTTTLKDYEYKINKIIKEMGDNPVDAISVKTISDFLKEFPPTQANRYRSLLSVIFKYAVAEGYLEQNPAAITMNRVIKKSRQRLKLTEYQEIYKASEPWLRNAMDLALITLQRREDIITLKFDDVKDGCLYVIQKKTQKHGSAAYLKIKINSSLQNVIDRCHDETASPFLIHRCSVNNRFDKKEHHTQINKDYLSKAFSAARDATSLFDTLAPYEKPTFHEIRSLGIKLYEDMGINAQSLAGHTNRKMTEQYKLGHDIIWTETEALLDLTEKGLQQADFTSKVQKMNAF